MALSPRANATVGPPKEVTSSSANPKTVYPSSSLHHEVVRSADLSCSAGINPGFGSLFGDLDAQRLPLSNFRMELPQSQHSFEGSKPPHDFLSLYGDSSSNCVEHRSSQGISTYLTTQDFLQPLERGGKDVVSSAETSAAAPTTTSGEHVLPGGIGTYTISHVSSYNHTNAKSDPPVVHVNGTEGKPEVTRGSTSSNYAGGGFKLWEERIVVDGGRTDGLAESDSTKEYLEKSGYWSTVRPKVGVSDLSFLAKTSFSLSSVEVNQQLLPSSSKQRHTNQGFVEMMKSIKAISEDDEDEDDEYLDRGRENRKEGSSLKGEAPPKADGKNNEQRANTPRSKHSATEQRRRSKINDRFQTLRELVPHSDQKRDKASFLLEVIEYIQVLQEKVRKYETTEQRWNQERMKTMVWDLCKKSSGLGEMPADGSQTVDGTRLESKQNGDTSDSNRSRLTSNTIRDENSIVTADMLPNSQNPLQSNKSSPVIPGCAPYKEKECTGVYNKSIPLPLSMQQCVYSPFGRSMMHNIHPKAQTTSEMQSLPGVQAITPSCMPINVYSFEKEKVGDSAAPVQLPYLQGNNATAMKTTNTLENHWSDLRSSQPSSTQQDSIRNQGMLLKDEATDTKSEAKLELQNSNAYFNSSTRISQYTTQSEAELASRQQQQPTSSTDRHRTDESRLAANEQEQLAIQGGVINVSSVYSQGLLDTLTQALQSSGLDLSQANISVQIELGRRGGTSMATTNIKEHSQNQEESSQTHQLQGQSRAADTASECEQPPKRPKIERDL